LVIHEQTDGWMDGQVKNIRPPVSLDWRRSTTQQLAENDLCSPGTEQFITKYCTNE